MTSDEVQSDTAAISSSLTHDIFQHMYMHLIHGRLCVSVKCNNLAGTSRYFTIQICIYIHTCLPAYLPTSVRPSVRTYTYIITISYTYIIYILYIYIQLYTLTHTHIHHIYIHTYLPAYLPTYLPPSVRTYVRTHIHNYN